LPLPPYIQQARSLRNNLDEDKIWYQTSWAEKPGSYAAPTASLHFKSKHIEQLIERGIQVEKITLHVGLGTFLPVTSEDLSQHQMHAEWATVSAQTWSRILSTKMARKKIWALGTTVARTLESIPQELLQKKIEDNGQISWSGWTKLLIQPGHEWKIVDVLMTNFHQPQSTLLALVAAFTNMNYVRQCYEWAIEKKFRLFSYGDFSIWSK
jgi:S-adenosylmethionine:tRNA ribosyltransferase-isomerase